MASISHCFSKLDAERNRTGAELSVKKFFSLAALKCNKYFKIITSF